MEVKEPRDAESASQASSTDGPVHINHLVLIPQPSTHPRDPLVCRDSSSFCRNYGNISH